MLAVNNLQCSYGGKILFKDVNLYFMKGQVSIIFGYNGSGKSTLMNTLLLLNTPDTGSLVYDNKKYNFDGNTDKENLPFPIGFLSQDNILWENMTCLENILFSLGNRYDGKKIQSLINTFDLQDIVKLYPSEVSLGQKQIIGFIRAIMINSNYLLLDEPTSAIDKENFHRIIEVINNEKKQDKTIIIITHDMRLSNSIGDKFYVIENQNINKVINVGEYFS
ncbi:MAG: amino acid ABC transporter ATP-binding protein [Candidatus Gracilibacteria bacterium]|nr:amino acid ABC transporter ATP-binding protein [Candidatus Gracilibacteria bacterium]